MAILCAVAGRAQDAGRALGSVISIDANSRQMVLKTDAGVQVSVAADPRATFRRVAPGETSLANAATIAITDIHPGDRVLARGKEGEDGKITATSVVVMSQSDIAARQAAERADWDRRGVTGIATEVTNDSVTINVRTLEGVKPLVIAPGPKAIIRRYAPDSVKFADAKASALGEIKKGDQVRARGDRSADGGKLTADEIVSGQFRMVAGVITAIDAQQNIIRINNLETKKPMVVKVSADSALKKLQPVLAQAIAARLHGAPPGDGAGPGGQGAGGVGGPGGERGAGGRGGGPGGFIGRGGFGGGRGGDLQQMIDRTPSITMADLKTGEAIIVSSTVGASADQVTAITLLAGVEPILTKPGTREMSLGDWNLNGDLGAIGGFGQ